MAAAVSLQSLLVRKTQILITFRFPHSRGRGHGQTRSDLDGASTSFCHVRCLAWFAEYTTPDDPEQLGPESMERFCADIGVEPENVAMLVLAYKMGARQMGYFTQEEWLRGMVELQCDSAAKMHAKLEAVRQSLHADAAGFKAVFRYAYDFARPDKDQRSMDIETARIMLQLLLAGWWPLFTEFACFLEQSKYRVINKDQWCNILEFSRTINTDLSNYDIDGACEYGGNAFIDIFVCL